MKYILLTFMLIMCAYGQYNADITGYNLYWYKLDAGQQPPMVNYHIVKSDTTLKFAWERGDENTQPYVTPYTGTVVSAIAIVNTPGLWDADTAKVSRTISLNDGIYEITATELDVSENESEPGQPLYIEVQTVHARILINLKVGNSP